MNIGCHDHETLTDGCSSCDLNFAYNARIERHNLNQDKREKLERLHEYATFAMHALTDNQSPSFEIVTNKAWGIAKLMNKKYEAEKAKLKLEDS